MKDHKRHPAAHSGAQPTPGFEGTSQVPLSQAATSEMKPEKSANHPAPGCSQKLSGEVKAAAKH